MKGATSKKGKRSVVETSAPVVLDTSRIHNEEGVAKVRLLVAGKTNEWGATIIKPGSHVIERRPGILQPVFLHTLFVGLVPPFSFFLQAILKHYDFHLLHLQPNFVVLLVVFAYFCEAFLGVMPSVVFFRHFYSLRVTAQGEIFGCVSFRLAPRKAAGLIPMTVTKKVEDFRQRWVLVETHLLEPLYHLPHDLPVKTKRWASH